jgi:LysM repeat protein
MVVRQRLFIHIALLLLFALALSACERPLRQDNATPTPGGAPTNTPSAVETVAQGVATEVGAVINTVVATEAAPTTEGVATEAAPTAEGGGAATEAATPVPPTAPATTAASEATATTGAGAQASTAVPTATTGGQPAVATATPVPTAASQAGGGQTAAQPLPATHTVAAGENLYRIGLRYGISWVTLAQFNGLTNANVLTVGQVLRIPGGGPSPTPVASPTPSSEVTYVVKAGDNLFRIGQAFGLNWRLIAEANGIVNPNQIFVGQVLKIPTNSPPGPAPQFTHVVRPGETLFLISLRYGVAWPAIAQANNITSPYVIYAGQTLVIPGG